jgi:Na+/melibiose symporter-like transporter
MLWLLVISALMAALSLVRRALALEREYIYAATGAASMIAALIMSFVNAGILGLAAALLASGICGVAVAQSRSWSV